MGRTLGLKKMESGSLKTLVAQLSITLVLASVSSLGLLAIADFATRGVLG